MERWTVAVAGLALCALSACSSSSSGGPPRSSYPALKPDVGQLVNRGGALLTSAKIVTVTWTVDPNESALEDFGDKLGASSYWKTVAGEYGGGPAISGAANHVEISTPPPAMIEETDLETWLVQQVGGTTSGWPAWDPETVYVVYVPTATMLTSAGVDTCQTHASMHAEVAVGNDPHVTYVFVDESCNGTRSVLDGATSAASHEILEAVTNPHTFSDQGVIGFDTAHLAWGLLDNQHDDEIGDTCEGFSDAFFTGPADLPYSLQRMWSNANAATGHSPCVPQSMEPYFNVTPIGMEMLDVLVGVAQTPKTALGYRVAVGSTRTFDVAYYSDAPTGYWDLTAVEGNGITPPAAPQLTLALAKGGGLNGDKDQVTVTVNSAGTNGNAILMTIVSTAPGHTTHYSPILIGAY